MRSLLVFTLVAMCATACNCSRRVSGTDAGVQASSGGRARARRPARVGTVFGRVLLAQGAELPRWSDADIGRDPQVQNSFPECGAPRDADTLPVTGVGTPTQLVGIMVSATGDRQTFFDALGDWEPQDRVANIRDCRLEPKVISATVGDTVVLTNDTNLAFLPHVGPTQFFETLVGGQTRRVPLEHGGLTAITCGFAAACGRSDLIVILHPVHTVTGSDGRFEMRNVPADQTVQIHAWHPRFRDAMVETRVARNGRVEVTLTLTPRAPRPAAPPTDPATPPPAAVDSRSDFPPGWENEPTITHPDTTATPMNGH